MLSPEQRKLSFQGHTLAEVREMQNQFFSSGETRSYEFRHKQLGRLLDLLIDREDEILEALHKDLRKPKFEGYVADIGLVRDEINYMRKNLRRLMRTKYTGSPISIWPARSKLIPSPLGTVLIIGAWNYPLQLTLAPLVGAMAAGNTAVLKPSELAPHSSKLLVELLGQIFSDKYIAVFEGGVEISQDLLDLPWDHIFFTGSTTVGKIVAQKAAVHLSPVTLELGGKSPAVVTKNANIPLAARRIAFGKFWNAGQTCVTTDYVLIDSSVQDQFVEEVRQQIKAFFGSNPQSSDSFCRIINERHFERLMSLVPKEKVAIGGGSDAKDLYIAPTVLKDVDWSDRIMEDEIFGPILPVVPFENLDKALEQINSRPSPLALYAFSDDSKEADHIIENVQFGGGCINDTTVHVATHFLPFGGVGMSGQGRYHGRYSFETFSHYKSIVNNPTFVDPPVRYPPYKTWKEKTVRFLIK